MFLNKNSYSNTRNKRKKIIILCCFVLICIIYFLKRPKEDTIIIKNNSIKFDKINVYTPTEDYNKQKDPLMDLLQVDYFKSKSLHKNIAIVIPFPIHHLDRAIKSLKRWNQPDKSPCNIDDPSIVGHQSGSLNSLLPDLVIYTNKLENKTMESQIKSIVSNSKWSICFSKLRFLYAELTDDQDGYPKGAANQFLKYYKMPIVNDYHYFMYLEPDVVPLRSNWVMEGVRLIYMTEATRRRPFMAIGSTVREKAAFKRTIVQRFHINGNGIWSTCNTMRQFLQLVEDHYKPYYGEGLMWYDGEFFEYLFDPTNWKVASVIYQDFIFYDFIQNYSQHPYDDLYIKENFPSTFLVHGENIDKEENKNKW